MQLCNPFPISPWTIHVGHSPVLVFGWSWIFVFMNYKIMLDKLFNLKYFYLLDDFLL